jgi:hypothetical protein
VRTSSQQCTTVQYIKLPLRGGLLTVFRLRSMPRCLHYNDQALLPSLRAPLSLLETARSANLQSFLSSLATRGNPLVQQDPNVLRRGTQASLGQPIAPPPTQLGHCKRASRVEHIMPHCVPCNLTLLLPSDVGPRRHPCNNLHIVHAITDDSVLAVSIDGHYGCFGLHAPYTNFDGMRSGAGPPTSLFARVT